MIKMIAVLALAIAPVAANAANVTFDSHGFSLLSAAKALDVPAQAYPAPETDNGYALFGSEKIVGGVEAVKGEFPFIVSLQAGSYGHFCGGSLIKKNWVLTAAHCVEGGYLKGVNIGLHHQSDTAGVEKFTVTQIVKHPKWNKNTMDYDFALVKLSGDSKYEPVALNSKELTGNVDFITAGWGTTSEGGSVSKILLKVSVPMVSKATCEKAYDGITDSMLCAGYPQGGKDSCQGDSGGPLITGTGANRVLAGVVSWGEGCAQPNKYGVYSKVSLGLPWINATAK
jgi:trypsin